MPWKPQKPCATPGCGRLTDGRFCDAHEREHHRDHDQKRRAAQPWRAWYNTARWRVLRSWRLSTEPLCRMCRDAGLTTAASVADHIDPHRGDEAKFFDPENTQSLCKSCHDGAKQRAERRPPRGR